MDWSTDEVTANGIRLAVHRMHPTRSDVFQEKRTALLIHGFLDAGRTWDLVAKPLAEAGYEVVAPDMRGFGDSGRIPSGGYYHFFDYVADVDDLVKQLAPEWLGVIGHSMGGGIAGLWVGTRPEKTNRLAILEGLGPNADSPNLAVDRMRAWLRDLGKIERAPRTIPSMAHAIERLAATHPHIDRGILATRAEILVRAGKQGDLTWAYDPLHRTTSPVPFQAEVFRNFLEQITCPTLFVSGGASGWHPDEEAERLKYIQNVRRIELPNAGHMMHWTAPLALAEALKTFLDAP